MLCKCQKFIAKIAGIYKNTLLLLIFSSFEQEIMFFLFMIIFVRFVVFYNMEVF